ncbi:hypothetical protein F5Y17DRAFT_468004 [Xylariaceae sp. FL0594]|nr:hypothetical protein F5Y17DRAFT_468004 [Xylariaceae sp. FL0594]
MSRQVTPRQILTQPKRPIQGGSGLTNSQGYKWPELGNRIALWEEFNLNTLNASYGHILDSPIPEMGEIRPRPQEALVGLTVNSDSDVNRLIMWNDAVLRPTLAYAKSRLRLNEGVLLRHQVTTPDMTSLAAIPGRLPPPDGWEPWPLRQLAQACVLAKTRYGYIQTEEEVTVCCFSSVEGDKKLKAFIMPIPLTRHGASVLTADLALWWLCMLAMSSPKNREIQTEEEMIKINDWRLHGNGNNLVMAAPSLEPGALLRSAQIGHTTAEVPSQSRQEAETPKKSAVYFLV